MRILRLSFFFLLVTLPAQALFGEEPLFTVAQVTSCSSFILSSGESVRLAGIEAPQQKEMLAEDAKAKLAALMAGGKLRLDFNPQNRDRYKRIMAQVYSGDGTWVQGAMLESGFAMVSQSDHADSQLPQMLAAERKAQRARRGIWAEDAWRVISPEETGKFINRFKVVEGTITSVNPWHENIYINFSDQWKGHFALFISRKYTDRFSLPALQSLAGKQVRVRRWIRYHNAPTMDITEPQQIETE